MHKKKGICFKQIPFFIVFNKTYFNEKLDLETNSPLSKTFTK